MVARYMQVFPGLDPENRWSETLKVVLGSTFVGKSDFMYEEGFRPLLRFHKEGWGTLGIAATDARVGAESGHWTGDEEHLWPEAEGKVVTWVGPGTLQSLSPKKPVREALVLLMEDGSPVMGICLTGSAMLLKLIEEGVEPEE